MRGRTHTACGHSRSAVRIGDRKSTRLNSSHLVISYAVFCLKKKTVALADSTAPRRGAGRDGQRAASRHPGGRVDAARLRHGEAALYLLIVAYRSDVRLPPRR